MKKLILLILAAALLLLGGCGGGENTPTEAPTEPPASAGGNDNGPDYSAYTSQVKVLCYNIFYQDVDDRQANIRDLLTKQDADVLLLQEVSVSWIPYLQAFMQETGYSYYGYGRHGGEFSDPNVGSGDQFVPILWKTDKYELSDCGHFWLSSTPDVVKSTAWVDGVNSKYPRCVNWVILKDKQTGDEFVAMNIHTDPESDLVRTNSCNLAVEMLETIADGLPVVVGGDWNMGLTSDGYSILKAYDYKDCRIVAPDADKGGSYNAWGDRAEDNFAYGDHIFITGNMAAEVFRVVDHRYDGVHISDHNPLMTILHYSN